jgi:hypothetical protein
MPRQADEHLYRKAIEWIRENPQDQHLSEEIKQAFLSFNTLPLENKIQLLITLKKLLNTTGLPEAIEQSFPWLMVDLDELPDELLLEIGSHLKNESDMRHLVSASKRMYSLFQPKRLLNEFLQRIAYGEEDKAEGLFTAIYQRNVEKIQQALLYQGRFTDYSGRIFKCSAYEYAYWAKDTHMCRMLESYMDDATKAEMLARVTELERTGLPYTQHGVAYCTHHFDLMPLINALRFYVDNYDAWHAARNWAAMEAAWMNVGLAQRDVPAHVAQEYCRPDRTFGPRSPFNEPAFRRILTFYNWITTREESWFPLTSANSGLGFHFALTRCGRRGWFGGLARPECEFAAFDLSAVSHLDEVRTVDLTQSRERLSPLPISQSMSV